MQTANVYYSPDPDNIGGAGAKPYVKISSTAVDCSDATGPTDGGEFYFDWHIDPATELTSGFS